MILTRVQHERHGMTYGPDGKRLPLHRLWLNIRNRCNNPKTPDYRYYGARGIRVCNRWDSFTAFVEDVGPHPGNGWTFNRCDNNGDYEPGNVRWAARRVQARDRNFYKIDRKTIDRKTADQIRKVYRQGGVRQVDLALQYEVTQPAISQIIRRTT